MQMMTKQILMVIGRLVFVYLFQCYIDFIVSFMICFMTIFSFLSNMDHFIQLYLCVFFAHTEEMASVYDEIDVKDEPLFPSLECEQVCYVFFMT